MSSARRRPVPMFGLFHRPDYERAYLWLVWKWWLLRVGIVAACVAIVWLIAGPVADAVNEWRAHRAAAEALRRMDAGDWAAAAAPLAEARRLRPADPAVIRADARTLAHVQDPAGLRCWEELRRLGPPSSSDWREYAALLAVAGRPEQVTAAAGEFLAAMGSGSPSDRLLAARLDARRGRPAEAAALARALLADAAADVDTRAGAALLLAGPGGAPLEAEVRGPLEAVAVTDSPTTLPALARLARAAIEAAGREKAGTAAARDATEIARRLKAHPRATAADVFLALDLETVLQVQSTESAAVEAVTRFGGDAEREDFLTLGRWLVARGDFERALDVVNEARARRAPNLALLHLQALFGLGRWADAKTLILSQRLPLDAAQIDLQLAICHTRLGESLAADNRWRRARAALAGRPDALLDLAAQAELHGAPEAARASCRDAVAADPVNRAAWLRLVRLAELTRETPRTWEVLNEMRRQFPADPTVAHDWAWLSALVGRELPAAERIATPLVERDGRNLPFRATLALARLRQKRAADAEAAWIGSPLADTRLSEGIAIPPAVAAVRAATLAAAGQLEAARILARSIPRAQLRAEEQALVQELQNP